MLTDAALKNMKSKDKPYKVTDHGDVQIGVEHPLWQAMARLFPEVFNGVVRAELQDLGRLPRWALPAAML